MVKDPALFIFQDTERMGEMSPTGGPAKPSDNIKEETDSSVEYRPISLYEYSLGLKNIQAEYITYKEAQAFVTKPVHLYGNVLEVELEASEEHPHFDRTSELDVNLRTSVEYYISYVQKPAVNDWLPILPKGQEEVLGERLFFNNNRATLRFSAKMPTIRVYQNGIEMPRGAFTLLNKQELSLEQPNDESIYTVNYTPDSYQQNPWTIQLMDYKEQTQRITEIFHGTDTQKTIHLDYTPFIDTERMLSEENYNPNTSAYRPIEVQLVNGSIQGRNNTLKKLVEPYRKDLEQEAYTYNKTLYLDKSWSDMKDYSLDTENYYGGFDYFHHENKLTFTEHFNVPRLQENLPYTHGNADIEVSYDALVTDFRLKIILRRNTETETTVTPKVNDYKLRFKTAR